MIQPKHFEYRVEDGVAVIQLARPDRLNALTFDSYAELRDTFAALQEEDEVRSVVLTGTGRAFCSGGDVKDIIGPLLDAKTEVLYRFTRMTCDLIRNMRLLDKPIVGAINGTACGAGAVMTAACDFRLASPEAKIAFLFVKVGLSGADMGAAWLLPRIVGEARASELLFLGEFVQADAAEQMGLYNAVHPAGDLMGRAMELARKLADGPSLGTMMTKRMLRVESTMSFEDALEAEAQAQALCMQHPDYREGFQAFLERRAPAFRTKTQES
ncbi:MAG: enoyl-CoA hydratase family protein [Planctomycetes bacterium]|nr:enoyl-CoA hydratase family protein [Planctomycetota bacterium]